MTVAEPIFLSTDELLAVHREQLALFGGTDGLRDENTLEGARGNAMSTLLPPEARLYEAMLGIATGELTRADLADVLRPEPLSPALASKRPDPSSTE